ncbi:hypothetical protein FLAG1_07792 [Fusarium langsethiae]|uniref:Uncharacterized protein n=1 Tax=Fusarium langsethiae TaxID=179993 RepID=A0A0N0V610_FUSLA|nr:hypothetical protein FLAG1_07792 [Fusarium langsethiae]GKU05066.1 unnamed protein product [Fusarium langsethiae]GKU22220.1 unnamed protein product [Fusarium langsethiae]
MVRTKTRVRTLEERFPNGPPKIYLPPKHPRTYHNRIFTDHNGKQALMSWSDLSINCPLPPLPCWVFYIVHPHTPSDFDGCAFFQRLEDGQDYGLTAYFRYEFFFLPDATVEECHAHYVAEIKSRGTIWDQIAKVKTAIELKEQESGKMEPGGRPFQYSPSDLDGIGNGQLPGLVVPEVNDNEYTPYSNWFFIYADANPDCSGPEGLTREIYVVQFDPIPEDIDIDSGDTFNATEHPIFSERMKARGEDGWEGGLLGYMGLRKNSRWRLRATEATGDAMKLGWKSW